MKVKISKTKEIRPAKTKVVEEEVEVWECPKCGGTWFRSDVNVIQIIKNPEDEQPNTNHVAAMRYAIVCVACEHPLYEHMF